MPIKRHDSKKWLSGAVEHGDTVYLAGLTADDRKAGMKGQTQQVLAKIDRMLAAAGTNKSKLLSVVVYISDMSRKEEMNEAWLAWIDPKNLPARATVAVTLGSADTLVEIMAIAAK